MRRIWHMPNILARGHNVQSYRSFAAWATNDGVRWPKILYTSWESFFLEIIFQKFKYLFSTADQYWSFFYSSKKKEKYIISFFHPKYFFLKNPTLSLQSFYFRFLDPLFFFFFISSFLPVLTLDTNFFELILSTNPWTQIAIHKMIQHFKMNYLGTKNVFLCFGLF